MKYFLLILLTFFSIGAVAQVPLMPTNLEVKGYDSHFELTWDQSVESSIVGYRIYRSDDAGASFELINTVSRTTNFYIDFVGREDAEKIYRIAAYNNVLDLSPFSEPDTASTFEMTDDELLTMVQEYTFRYFWDFAHPVSGLTRERNTTSIVTSGGSGFGTMAILVGIERGFITKEEGLTRLLKIVDFLGERADRFKGVWPHWMNGANGTTVPFSQLDNGGDLVETSFMIQGLLTVREYFDGTNEREVELRDKITTLWEEVDWNWHRKLTQNVLWWHWSPQFNFDLNLRIRGYNESLITYLLAIASPTKRVPASLYHDGWAGNSSYVNGREYYDIELPVGPNRGGPLFFAHYSFLGFDPRGIEDDYTNYFIQNINHSLINQAHSIENPNGFEGYSEICWGLTASDDPIRGYWAHSPVNDNGTITPTAALSSIPYTPVQSMAALKHFYRDLGDRLWGRYGFYDAFNLTEDWFATSYLAIDQGPIIIMIENYRSELLWNNFMKNSEITDAMEAIGFRKTTTTVQRPLPLTTEIFPNPVQLGDKIFINLEESASLNIQISDLSGREWLRMVTPTAKNHQIDLISTNLTAGVYLLTLKDGTRQSTHKLFITK